MSVQPLLTPVRMGDLDLPNRIVMAPLTRMRAGSFSARGRLRAPKLRARRRFRSTSPDASPDRLHVGDITSSWWHDRQP